jgi:hypothetical protein
MNLFQITQRTLVNTATALVVSIAFLSSAWADPPGRVARLSEFAGDVQIGHTNSGWQPIQRNYPITAGDNVWVSDGGRAELDVGQVQVWLSGGSSVYFDRFDDQTLNARLTSGAMAVRIRQWESGDAMRVTTEHGEINFTQPGLYFVSAGLGGNPSVVNARFGQAELNVFGRRQWVSRGESIAFDSRGVLQDRYASAYYSGGFDGWVVARDRRISRWESRNRDDVNPWMIGVRDLDDHGYWDSTYEYGRVWYPRSVSSSWAPYRYGRWSHVQPWGWTWIDDAPWGFAPFHYGRWVRLGGRWAWSPGSYTGRPVYAPALVTFFGGNGWSISASTGPSYSWVPLGWNEPYAPWYTYTNTHWRHVNRPYVRNIAEDPWRPPTYTHAGVPGAITAVAAATFLGGRHIAQNHIRNVSEADVRSAPQARVNEIVPQWRGARATDPNPIVRQALPQRGFEPNAGGARPVIVNERAALPAQVQPNTAVVQPRVWQDPNPVAPRANVGREIVRGNPPQTQPTFPAPVQQVFPAPSTNVGREVIRNNAPQAAPQIPAQQVQPARPVQAVPVGPSYPNPQLQPQQAAPPAVINRPNPVIERRGAPEQQPEGPRSKDRLERKPALEPRSDMAPPVKVAQQPQPSEIRQSKVKEVGGRD